LINPRSMISEAVTEYPINDYVSRMRFKHSVRKCILIYQRESFLILVI